jgi:hypothetical protein
MSSRQIARVHYFDRQYLRTRDFEDEQQYHVDLRRRHNIGHHRWGIVQGLELYDDGEGGLFVQPGMAVDGYGRELIVPAARPLDASRFDVRGDSLAVWLVWDQRAAETAPANRCDDGEAAFYRWTESPDVRLETADPDADPRMPDGVPADDLEFGPSSPQPSANQVWPVFLGIITRTEQGPPPVYTITRAGRPYAGLVGETVTAVSSGARLQLGVGESKSLRRRFAAFVAGESRPSLEIGEGGEIDVRGETTVEGDLSISTGAVAFGAGDLRERESPWRIHRVDYQDAGSAVRALRIEMGTGSGDRNEVVVGTWSEGRFKACLTVDDSCTVTVHGNLVVEGQLDVTGAPVQPPAGTPAAMAALLTPATAAELVGATLDRFAVEDAERDVFATALRDAGAADRLRAVLEAPPREE